MNNQNLYWKGRDGNLWVNDEAFEKVKEFECKMTMEWEDVPDGMTKDRVLMGYAVEGSFTYRKTDNNHAIILDLILDNYIKGIVPDVNIIGKAFNGATNVTERLKISGITFDELQLQKWGEKSLVEVQIPFKATLAERL